MRRTSQQQWSAGIPDQRPDPKTSNVLKAVTLYEARDIDELEKWKAELQAQERKDFHALRIVTKYIQKYYEA